MPYGEMIRLTRFTWFTRFEQFSQLDKQYNPSKISKSCKLSKLLFLCSMLLALCCFYSEVDARVKGKCKDCHTMHYSKEGLEVTYSYQQGPFPSMTIGGCLGCHGQNPSGTENIISKGKMRVPQVIHHMEEGDLAGGNYYYVADLFSKDYSKGHNVKGISLIEKPPMNTPPGFIESVNIPGGTGPSSWPSFKQLTCSGTYGCHGNRTIEDEFVAIHGAHHEDDSIIDGSTVGKSYRFLYGIVGKEHEKWEYLATENNHNGYKGDQSHDSMNTISYLCGECHGKFHPNPNLGGSKEVGHAYNSLWRRHPSDISFSGVHGGYIGSEYQGYVNYNLQSPVAYQNPSGTENIVDSDSIIMCLSCHRAHASQYSDILRWDYSEAQAGNQDTKKGCLVCHTKKAR